MELRRVRRGERSSSSSRSRAVSEIALPLTFAAVLAVIFKPLVGSLARRGLKPSVGAGVVVLGLLALMTAVLVGTVQGVLHQTDQISASVDAAIANAAGVAGGRPAGAGDGAGRRSKSCSPTIAEGFLAGLVSGASARSSSWWRRSSWAP